VKSDHFISKKICSNFRTWVVAGFRGLDKEKREKDRNEKRRKKEKDGKIVPTVISR